jgi:hypothetical protein
VAPPSTTYHCPTCGTLLEDEGYQFWCRKEDRAVSYGEIVQAEEDFYLPSGDPDDE